MDSVPPMSNLPTPAPLIIVPSGVGESVHAFGTEMLFHLTGKQTDGRSEVFFARCAEEFAKPGAPDLARIVEISAEHGIHYVKIPGTNDLLDPFIA